MKASMWILAVVFLAVSIPLLLLMHAADFGGEYRLMIAMGAGALVTAIVQGRLATRGDGK